MRQVRASENCCRLNVVLLIATRHLNSIRPHIAHRTEYVPGIRNDTYVRRLRWFACETFACCANTCLVAGALRGDMICYVVGWAKMRDEKKNNIYIVL